jgi:hypothetical protein
MRLVPPAARLDALRADYAAMSEMFFGDPPTFDEILEVLQEIETTVNRLTAPQPGSAPQ